MNDNNLVVNHYIFQRRTLGLLCILLAPMCVICGLPFWGFNAAINPGWWHSVSETYYASSKMIMIGLLMSAGIFELSYKGYDWKDSLVNKITGILSFGVVAFPCCIPGVETDGFFNLPANICSKIHFVDAGLLFFMFALNIMWLFTKTGDKNFMTEKKKIRNKIYYGCGIVILVNLVLMGLRSLLNWPNGLVIVFEGFMLISFGFAFMVKGESFNYFND